ncbi:hypothetical protein APS56_12000 [Pseudalgibacter alginicilyticus]|uniref:Nickel transporter n=1 Tax=Pseudalgibacter alginicilyticus TaxID=1736674 RepID=A0A0P0D4B2_9FLAO|nr:hypothetical protein [Pseudalgibacter alginicilyticus]ALJ05804.1 hypothetical protein APS56_12000 [Pseudalgibacter alginicilyticus]
MKKISKIIGFLSVLLIGQVALAHGYWVETKRNGKINQPQEVKVYFSEPNDTPEPTNGEEWAMVKDFTLYVISPSGIKTALTTTIKPDYYGASFTPKELGNYFVILESTDLAVMEPGKKHAFIPIFYATSLVEVGEVDAKEKPINVLDYVPMGVYAQIKKGRKGESLNYTFKNKENTKFMTTIITPNGQRLQVNGTPESFNISDFEKGTYTTQMMIIEKTNGSKNGEVYNTVYHIATSRFVIE